MRYRLEDQALEDPDDVEHLDSLKANQQLAPARTVKGHRGSPRSVQASTPGTLVETPDLCVDPQRVRPRSNAKVRFEASRICGEIR